jgi:hypothetical protein
MIIDWQRGNSYFGIEFWDCWISQFYPVPDFGRGLEHAGGYRRKGEVKIPDELYRAMEDDEILEIIAAILRVL